MRARLDFTVYRYEVVGNGLLHLRVLPLQLLPAVRRRQVSTALTSTALNCLVLNLILRHVLRQPARRQSHGCIRGARCFTQMVSPREGRCEATCTREFKLPWREMGPPNHLNARVDPGQEVVKKELSLVSPRETTAPADPCRH